VEAEVLAAERARSKRRTKALAEVYARTEDLEALDVSLERELAAVRARYAEHAVAVTAARDGALLDLADLGRAPAAIAASTGMSLRDVHRALTTARHTRGQDTNTDDGNVNGNGPAVGPGDAAPTGPDSAPQAAPRSSPAPAPGAVGSMPGTVAGDAGPGTRVIRLEDRRPPAPPAPAAQQSQGLRAVAVGEHVPLRPRAPAAPRPSPAAGAAGSGGTRQDTTLF